MPNTLAHLGVQTVCSKTVIPEADFKWIALGCVLPDAPWVLQRLALLFNGDISYNIALRIYCMIQASLFFCLILSSALSLLSRNSKRVFLLLGLNCCLHLLLDSLQQKWANGVHLFAPLSWKLTSFSLFWPEHWVTYSLTLIGLLCLFFFAYQERRRPIELNPRPVAMAASSILLLLYLLLPLAFFHGPLQSNSHYVQTLQDVQRRTGKQISIDRGLFNAEDKTLQIFTGEELLLSGTLPVTTGILSVQGTFSNDRTIKISAYHCHNKHRNYFNLAGLSLILLIWLLALLKKTGKVRVDKDTNPCSQSQGL